MATANCLVDDKMTSSSTPTQKGKGQKQESNRKSDTKTFKKNGGKGWKKPDAQAKVVDKATSLQATKPSGCFIYDGPHRSRDPKKEKLNALIAEDGENSGSKATHKGLMYIESPTGGQKIVALVDSEATHNFILTRETHNFILTRETARLVLKFAKDGSKLKAVNSQARDAWPGKERGNSYGRLERYDRLP